MTEEKTAAELLKEKLCMNQKHAAQIMREDEIVQADEFCTGYKKFITLCKTEREAATCAEAAAKKV